MPGGGNRGVPYGGTVTSSPASSAEAAAPAGTLAAHAGPARALSDHQFAASSGFRG
jgi:hypothetical protein